MRTVAPGPRRTCLRNKTGAGRAVGHRAHDGPRTATSATKLGAFKRFRDYPNSFSTAVAMDPPSRRAPVHLSDGIRRAPSDSDEGPARMALSVMVGVDTDPVGPMIPRFVCDEPGACPICGMALEPRRVVLHDRQSPRGCCCCFSRCACRSYCSVPVVMVSDTVPSRPLHQTLGARTAGWLTGAPRCSWAGWPFFPSARGLSIVNRHRNMFMLMVRAPAWCHSVRPSCSLAENPRLRRMVVELPLAL